MTFGEKLHKLRAREGLSQERLAELLDVSRQAVSKWERDETMPETEKVVRISEHFSVTTDYLLKDGPESRPPQGGHGWQLKDWYQEKGYQVGWVHVCLGLLGYLWMLFQAWSFPHGTSPMITDLLWEALVSRWLNLYLVLSGLVVLAAGKRLKKPYRLYQLGWLWVLPSVFGLLGILPKAMAMWMDWTWLLRCLPPMYQPVFVIPYHGSNLLVGCLWIWTGKRKKA